MRHVVRYAVGIIVFIALVLVHRRLRAFNQPPLHEWSSAHSRLRDDTSPAPVAASLAPVSTTPAAASPIAVPADRPPHRDPQVVLPESASTGPGVQGFRKIIVMAKTHNENTDWVEQELPEWERAIYSFDDRGKGLLPLDANKGNEANAYLTYIIENYDRLADVIVFLHAHRGGFPRGWHIDNDDYDNVVSMRRLQLDTVLRDGYVNLRCQFEPGCPIFIEPARTSSDDDDHRQYEQAFLSTWPLLFPGEPLPDYVGAACCAQFAVSKKQVRARPRSDYERYKKWLMETPLDDHVSGTMLEYLYHIIFGRESMFCPDIWKCYCDVYGEECYVLEDLDGSYVTE